MTRSTTLGVALALVAATAACSGSSSNNSTITAPTGTLVTDTFTGTVPVGGLDFQNFTVTKWFCPQMRPSSPSRLNTMPGWPASAYSR